MKSLLIALAASTIALATVPALAGEREDQLSLCASALDEQGLAALDAYRTKFVKAKGGALQKIIVKLVPLADGPSLTAECLIKRGEVTSATILSDR